jgi:2-dehydro-3-deoxygluconokinase
MSALWHRLAPPDGAKARIAAIGECMIEIVRGPEGTTSFGYAGDTLNTTIYLARCGLNPSYVTALGTDPFSDGMLAFWVAEGIDTSLVIRRPDKLPGLYIVTTDAAGERKFHYWRNDSAARTLFALPGDDAALGKLSVFPLIYWSGISLAILAPQARQKLLDALARHREAGRAVVFDANYRPRLWPNAEAARNAYTQALAHADVVFTSAEDEAPIFGGDTASLIERHKAAGVRESVVKTSQPGCHIVVAGDSAPVTTEAPPVRHVVDTTAAGDSFAAAYIAARLGGLGPRDAAMAGHRLAGAVVGVRGAILSRDRMPSLFSPDPQE